jgi:hypothetical protein
MNLNIYNFLDLLGTGGLVTLGLMIWREVRLIHRLIGAHDERLSQLERKMADGIPRQTTV